ncbi:MAG: hypothetical protein HZB53_10070 [Chloroflexi bacterium]|nr:hypothetical protein [Chloroflexota bacterium]
MLCAIFSSQIGSSPATPTRIALSTRAATPADTRMPPAPTATEPTVRDPVDTPLPRRTPEPADTHTRMATPPGTDTPTRVPTSTTAPRIIPTVTPTLTRPPTHTRTNTPHATDTPTRTPTVTPTLDHAPPTITNMAVSPTALTYSCGGSGNVTITANVSDASTLSSVTAYSAYWRSGASSAASPLASTPMQFFLVNLPGSPPRSWWGGTIDASDSAYYLGGSNGWLQYYIGATDNKGNTGYTPAGWIAITGYACIK